MKLKLYLLLVGLCGCWDSTATLFDETGVGSEVPQGADARDEDGDGIIDSEEQENAFNLWQKAVVIPHEAIGSDQDSFQLLFSLENDQDLKKNFSAGSGLEFHDQNGHSMHHEVLSFDPAAGTLHAWVFVPRVTSSVDTTVYMRVGKLNTTPTVPTNPWSPYVMVNQFEEGTTDPDTTGNFEVVTATGFSEQPRGMIGAAAQFTGAQGGATLRPRSPDKDLLFIDSTSFTTSVWFQTLDSASEQTLFFRPFIEHGSRSARIFLNAQNQVIGCLATVWIERCLDPTPAVAINSWNHVALVYHQPTQALRLFINGKLHQQKIVTWPEIGPKPPKPGRPQSGVTLVLGRGYTNNTSFNGVVDELRLAGQALSETRISLEYLNQRDPQRFYRLGALEPL